jgi:hypothetical protein
MPVHSTATVSSFTSPPSELAEGEQTEPKHENDHCRRDVTEQERLRRHGDTGHDERDRQCRHKRVRNAQAQNVRRSARDEQPGEGQA